MKHVFIAVGIAVGAGICEANMMVENSNYRVELDENNYSLTINRHDLTDCSIQEATLDGSIVSAEKKSIEDPTFGNGQAILCKAADGAVTSFMLFDDLPFVAVRKSLVNNTDKQLRIDKCEVISMNAAFSTSAGDLVTRGTAGLQKLGKKEGSYVFSTIADKNSGNGLVTAWVSFDRGSGVTFHGAKRGTITQSARIDYGDLRLDPGESETGELLVIGLFDDVRLGLEQYAQAVKTYYDIKLNPLPSVYCTWYHARASDEKRLAQNVDFVDTNLDDYGLSVMQIDDYWQLGKSHNGPRKNFSAHDPKGPFPSGMKATADNIKKHGLIPGIWFMPFAGSYNDPYFADKQDMFYKVGTGYQKETKNVAKKAGMKVKDMSQMPYDTRWGGTCIDMSNPKSREFLSQMVKRIANDWGYEYFKMDGLWTGTGTAIRYVNNEYNDDDLGKPLRFDPKVTPIEAYRLGLDVLRDSAGDDIFFLGCCMVQNCRSFGASFGGFDAMRVGPDNGASIGGLPRGPQYSTRYYFLNKRVWHNDPDPMYFRSEITADAAKMIATWVTLNGGLGASSYDYYELPPERLDILKRTMPSHNSLESRPLDFLENDISHAWLLKDRSSGPERILVGHYNWDSNKLKQLTTDLTDLGLAPDKQYIGFDYWNNRFIPPFSGSIASDLSPFSCRSIAIYPVKEYPQLISTSRHITQGIVDVTKERWTGSTLVLSCNLVANDPYELRIAVPQGNSWKLDDVIQVDAPEGISATTSQDGPNIRVMLNSPQTTALRLSLTFSKATIAPPAPPALTSLNGQYFQNAVHLSWDTNGSGNGFNIFRNGRQLGSTLKNSYSDTYTRRDRTYTYRIEPIGWNGETTVSKLLAVTTDPAIKLPPLPPAPDVSIATLKPIGSISTGWGTVGINKSVSGNPMRIDGQSYTDGINSDHANWANAGFLK